MPPLNNLLCENQLLTGSAANSINTVPVGGRGQHTLYITYSPDTDSTNALEVTIELSPNGTDFYPYTGEYSSATGAATPGATIVLTYGSDGVTDQLEAPYFFTGSAQEIRITVTETNTPADFGNITARLFSALS